MVTKKLLALLLALCLLAGCTAGNGPAASGSSAAPAEPPASAGGAPAESEPPDDILPADTLPQEDPERPGELAGHTRSDGHRRILCAVDPQTGEYRVVRERAFWNGLETAAVSPSGRRLLLAAGDSLDGSGGWMTAALSLYDMGADRLVNLTRPAGERMAYGKQWMAYDHWFPNHYGYCFTDEDTLFCRELFYSEETPEEGRLWFWDIDGDGAAAHRVLRVACPALDTGAYGSKWARGCVWLPEEGAVLCRVCTRERGWEWLTWDGESGELLSRSPAENAAGDLCADPMAGRVLYSLDRRDWDRGIFHLTAYSIDTDTREVLLTGPVPENRSLALAGIREGALVFRSEDFPGAGSRREALWRPENGGPLTFGEVLTEPAAPLLARWRERHTKFDPPPVCIAALPGGELLFLAL